MTIRGSATVVGRRHGVSPPGTETTPEEPDLVHTSGGMSNMTDASARILQSLREGAPLVQCITNAVVINYTANALLAAGAAPVMADVPGEAAELAPNASALLVNLGTPDDEQRRAMLEAA